MKVTRLLELNTGTYEYWIEQEEKILRIAYRGNDDLYFSLMKKDKESLENSIVISEDNKELYNVFDELYNDVKNCNVLVEIDSFQAYQCRGNEEELERLEEEKNESIKRTQEKLFVDNKINWVSDDADFDGNSNSFEIKKEDDNIVISFNLIEEMNNSVRISNSGSRFDPYNTVFMRMFNKLQEYDPESDQKTKKTSNSRTYKYTNNDKA